MDAEDAVAAISRLEGPSLSRVRTFVEAVPNLSPKIAQVVLKALDERRSQVQIQFDEDCRKIVCYMLERLGSESS